MNINLSQHDYNAAPVPDGNAYYGNNQNYGNQNQPQGNYGMYDPNYMNNQQNQQQNPNVFQNTMLNDIAFKYGSDAIGQGADMVNKQVNKFVSLSKLKYYFAVDNKYVASKIGLILFPYAHRDWSNKYELDGPVPPRNDLNAPDLYIPIMAFVTYVLISGIVLGAQNHFTPEQLGIQSSQALCWILIENLLLSFSLYMLNLQTKLSYLDVIAFSGYKFISMIAVLLGFLVMAKLGWYVCLAWTSLSIAFFLMRTLKVQILSNYQPSTIGFDNHMVDEQSFGMSKKHVYFLLIISFIQPLIVYILTSKLIFGSFLY